MSNRSTSTSLDEAVDGAKHQGRSTVLRCPAHEDNSPSLSVSPGSNQDAVIHCHAGCSTEDVLAAAGLTWADISAPLEQRETASIWTPAGDTTSDLVYTYHDEDGTLLYQVLRYNAPDGGKRIFQRSPDPQQVKGPWKWNMDGVRRVPWHLPALIEAVEAGHTIHIAEGESCVRALEAVIGQGEVATCNSGGAGKWDPKFEMFFNPGTRVIIYADADDPGRAHAREIRESLVDIGCHVRTVEAPPGTLRNGKAINDVADHLAAGRTLDELLETTPESDAERARTGVDILDLIRRPRGKTEWAIENTLAKGERVLLVGLEGQGKSVMLRQWAATVAAGLHPFDGTHMEPKRVLYIDAENHPEQVIESWSALVGLCAAHSHPIDTGMLTVLEEWDGERDFTRVEDRLWLNERVNAYRPDVIMLGPLTNLVEGDMGKYETVHALRRAVNSTRNVCNSAIVMEHHAPLRGAGEKVREVRPYGNGLFYKWPDFGFAMVPDPDDKGKYEWRRFRGDRVRGRNWPEAVRWGSQAPNSMEFPWVPDMW